MKEVIHTPHAPAPIGPYSQGIKHGNLHFFSGMIAINPTSGELVLSSIEAETRQVMQNIEALLTASNLTFANIVKTSIFLKTMDDFATVNGIYGEYFTSEPPARETVAVAGLPKGVNVEISVTAIG
ncbi:MAG: RidA family protein [Bacteroidia bacterium]